MIWQPIYTVTGADFDSRAKGMKSANHWLPAVLLLALWIFCLTPTFTRADQQSTRKTNGALQFVSKKGFVQNATSETANTTTTSNVTNLTDTNVTLPSSSAAGTVNNNRTEQHSVTISVVQGQGEACLSSQDQLPVCTTGSETLLVNGGELVNIDATPASGFIWDRYGGLGSGQGQNFNVMITQNGTADVYFTQASMSNMNLTVVSVPTNNVATTTSEESAPTIAVPNVPVTVTQNVNQTVSITQTEASSTINYTVTSTVANNTITFVVNETTTVSTTTGP